MMTLFIGGPKHGQYLDVDKYLPTFTIAIPPENEFEFSQGMDGSKAKPLKTCEYHRRCIVPSMRISQKQYVMAEAGMSDDELLYRYDTICMR